MACDHLDKDADPNTGSEKSEKLLSRLALADWTYWHQLVVHQLVDEQAEKLLLVVQAITGLVLAGTDVFYPPPGNWIAQ